jgi:DNA-directed RNA polymerase subunit RPC12/RpoP
MKLSQKTCPQCSGTLFKELSPDEVQCEYCGSRFFLNESSGSLTRHDVAADRGKQKNNRKAVTVIAIILGLGLAGAIFSFREKPQGLRGPSGKLNSISSGKSAVSSDTAEGRLRSAYREGDLKGSFSMVSEIPDTIGNVYFIGFYKNTGREALNRPKITIILHSPEGRKVASGYGYAVRTFLLPGESTPVRIIVRTPPRYSRYEVYDEPKPPYSFYRLNRGKAVFENVRIEARRFSGYELQGSIVNKGGAVMRSIQLAAVLKDGEGAITGYGSQFVAAPPLAPGDYAPFRIQVFRTVRKPVSWVIDYSCRVEQ